MIAHIFKFTGITWDDEIANNTQMFFEADQLDAAAYEIIKDGNPSSEQWARFTEAKKIADACRTAAYQDWMRIKRRMAAES